MKIYLIRHADFVKPNNKVLDTANLTPDGWQLSASISIMPELLDIDYILADPIRRCKQTVLCLSKTSGIPIRTHKIRDKYRSLLKQRFPKLLSRKFKTHNKIAYCYRRENLPGIEAFFELDLLEQAGLSLYQTYSHIILVENISNKWIVKKAIKLKIPKGS